jgi:small subunit ribosomal protein S18
MATQKSNKKKKTCPIEEAGMTRIDYKDTAFLKKFLTKFNRIIPRYYSGTTLQNQKKLASAIKRARYMSLLPYVLDVKFQSAATPSAVVADTPVIDESAVAV